MCREGMPPKLRDPYARCGRVAEFTLGVLGENSLNRDHGGYLVRADCFKGILLGSKKDLDVCLDAPLERDLKRRSGSASLRGNKVGYF